MRCYCARCGAHPTPPHTPHNTQRDRDAAACPAAGPQYGIAFHRSFPEALVTNFTQGVLNAQVGGRAISACSVLVSPQHTGFAHSDGHVTLLASHGHSSQLYCRWRAALPDPPCPALSMSTVLGQPVSHVLHQLCIFAILNAVFFLLLFAVFGQPFGHGAALSDG